MKCEKELEEKGFWRHFIALPGGTSHTGIGAHIVLIGQLAGVWEEADMAPKPPHRSSRRDVRPQDGGDDFGRWPAPALTNKSLN